MKQLSQDPNNLIIAFARNPDKATQLKPLLGPNVVPLKADIADFDSRLVVFHHYRIYPARVF